MNKGSSKAHLFSATHANRMIICCLAASLYYVWSDLAIDGTPCTWSAAAAASSNNPVVPGKAESSLSPAASW